MSYDSLQDTFVNDIKRYLKDNLNILLEDYELKKVNVENAYSYQKAPTPPEIAILVTDDSDNEESDTYDDVSEVLNNFTIHFYCYGKEMRIKDSDNRYDPIQVTRILADYVKRLMKKNTLGVKNPNVISSIRTTQTNVMNIRDSSLYYCVLRYEIVVRNDYKKVYRD